MSNTFFNDPFTQSKAPILSTPTPETPPEPLASPIELRGPKYDKDKREIYNVPDANINVFSRIDGNQWKDNQEYRNKFVEEQQASLLNDLMYKGGLVPVKGEDGTVRSVKSSHNGVLTEAGMSYYEQSIGVLNAAAKSENGGYRYSGVSKQWVPQFGSTLITPYEKQKEIQELTVDEQLATNGKVDITSPTYVKAVFDEFVNRKEGNKVKEDLTFEEFNNLRNDMLTKDGSQLKGDMLKEYLHWGKGDKTMMEAFGSKKNNMSDPVAYKKAEKEYYEARDQVLNTNYFDKGQTTRTKGEQIFFNFDAITNIDELEKSIESSNVSEQSKALHKAKFRIMFESQAKELVAEQINAENTKNLVQDVVAGPSGVKPLIDIGEVVFSDSPIAGMDTTTAYKKWIENGGSGYDFMKMNETKFDKNWLTRAQNKLAMATVLSVKNTAVGAASLGLLAMGKTADAFNGEDSGDFTEGLRSQILEKSDFLDDSAKGYNKFVGSSEMRIGKMTFSSDDIYSLAGQMIEMVGTAGLSQSVKAASIAGNVASRAAMKGASAEVLALATAEAMAKKTAKQVGFGEAVKVGVRNAASKAAIAAEAGKSYGAIRKATDIVKATWTHNLESQIATSIHGSLQSVGATMSSSYGENIAAGMTQTAALDEASGDGLTAGLATFVSMSIMNQFAGGFEAALIGRAEGIGLGKAIVNTLGKRPQGKALFEAIKDVVTTDGRKTIAKGLAAQLGASLESQGVAGFSRKIGKGMASEFIEEGMDQALQHTFDAFLTNDKKAQDYIMNSDFVFEVLKAGILGSLMGGVGTFMNVSDTSVETRQASAKAKMDSFITEKLPEIKRQLDAGLNPMVEVSDVNAKGKLTNTSGPKAIRDVLAGGTNEQIVQALVGFGEDSMSPPSQVEALPVVLPNSPAAPAAPKAGEEVPVDIANQPSPNLPPKAELEEIDKDIKSLDAKIADIDANVAAGNEPPNSPMRALYTMQKDLLVARQKAIKASTPAAANTEVSQPKVKESKIVEVSLAKGQKTSKTKERHESHKLTTGSSAATVNLVNIDNELHVQINRQGTRTYIKASEFAAWAKEQGFEDTAAIEQDIASEIGTPDITEVPEAEVPSLEPAPNDQVAETPEVEEQSEPVEADAEPQASTPIAVAEVENVNILPTTHQSEITSISQNARDQGIAVVVVKTAEDATAWLESKGAVLGARTKKAKFSAIAGTLPDGTNVVIIVSTKNGRTKKIGELKTSFYHELAHIAHIKFNETAEGKELGRLLLEDIKANGFDKFLTKYMKLDYLSWEKLTDESKLAEITRAIVNGKIHKDSGGSRAFQKYVKEFLEFLGGFLKNNKDWKQWVDGVEATYLSLVDTTSAAQYALENKNVSEMRSEATIEELAAVAPALVDTAAARALLSKNYEEFKAWLANFSSALSKFAKTIWDGARLHVATAMGITLLATTPNTHLGEIAIIDPILSVDIEAIVDDNESQYVAVPSEYNSIVSSIYSNLDNVSLPEPLVVSIDVVEKPKKLKRLKLTEPKAAELSNEQKTEQFFKSSLATTGDETMSYTLPSDIAIEWINKGRSVAVASGLSLLNEKESSSDSIKELLVDMGINESPSTFPWCSTFTSWALNKEGVQVRSHSARAFLNYGKTTKSPVYGDVAVLWNTNPLTGGKNGYGGHTGFYLGETADYVVLLNGNAEDSVAVTVFPKDRVLSYRHFKTNDSNLAKSSPVNDKGQTSPVELKNANYAEDVDEEIDKEVDEETKKKELAESEAKEKDRKEIAPFTGSRLYVKGSTLDVYEDKPIEGEAVVPMRSLDGNYNFSSGDVVEIVNDSDQLEKGQLLVFERKEGDKNIFKLFSIVDSKGKINKKSLLTFDAYEKSFVAKFGDIEYINRMFISDINGSLQLKEPNVFLKDIFTSLVDPSIKVEDAFDYSTLFDVDENKAARTAFSYQNGRVIISLARLNEDLQAIRGVIQGKSSPERSMAGVRIADLLRMQMEEELLHHVVAMTISPEDRLEFYNEMIKNPAFAGIDKHIARLQGFDLTQPFTDLQKQVIAIEALALVHQQSTSGSTYISEFNDLVDFARVASKDTIDGIASTLRRVTARYSARQGYVMNMRVAAGLMTPHMKSTYERMNDVSRKMGMINSSTTFLRATAIQKAKIAKANRAAFNETVKQAFFKSHEAVNEFKDFLKERNILESRAIKLNFTQGTVTIDPAVRRMMETKMPESVIAELDKYFDQLKEDKALSSFAETLRATSSVVNIARDRLVMGSTDITNLIEGRDMSDLSAKDIEDLLLNLEIDRETAQLILNNLVEFNRNNTAEGLAMIAAEKDNDAIYRLIDDYGKTNTPESLSAGLVLNELFEGAIPSELSPFLIRDKAEKLQSVTDAEKEFKSSILPGSIEKEALKNKIENNRRSIRIIKASLVADNFPSAKNNVSYTVSYWLNAVNDMDELITQAHSLILNKNINREGEFGREFKPIPTVDEPTMFGYQMFSPMKIIENNRLSGDANVEFKAAFQAKNRITSRDYSENPIKVTMIQSNAAYLGEEGYMDYIAARINGEDGIDFEHYYSNFGFVTPLIVVHKQTSKTQAENVLNHLVKFPVENIEFSFVIEGEVVTQEMRLSKLEKLPSEDAPRIAKQIHDSFYNAGRSIDEWVDNIETVIGLRENSDQLVLTINGNNSFAADFSSQLGYRIQGVDVNLNDIKNGVKGTDSGNVEFDLAQSQTEIVFNESKHIYFDSGFERKSVTTLKGEHMLFAFDEAVVAEGIARSPKHQNIENKSPYFGLNKAQILKKWRLNSERGTRFHEEISKALESPDGDHNPNVLAIANKIRSIAKGKIVSEKMVRVTDAIGTLDLLIQVEKEDGTLAWHLFDFKVSDANPYEINEDSVFGKDYNEQFVKNGVLVSESKAESHRVQLAAYAKGLAASGLIVENSFILPINGADFSLFVNPNPEMFGMDANPSERTLAYVDEIYQNGKNIKEKFYSYDSLRGQLALLKEFSEIDDSVSGRIKATKFLSNLSTFLETLDGVNHDIGLARTSISRFQSAYLSSTVDADMRLIQEEGSDGIRLSAALKEALQELHYDVATMDAIEFQTKYSDTRNKFGLNATSASELLEAYYRIHSSSQSDLRIKELTKGQKDLIDLHNKAWVDSQGKTNWGYEGTRTLSIDLGSFETEDEASTKAAQIIKGLIDSQIGENHRVTIRPVYELDKASKSRNAKEGPETTQDVPLTYEKEPSGYKVFVDYDARAMVNMMYNIEDQTLNPILDLEQEDTDKLGIGAETTARMAAGSEVSQEIIEASRKSEQEREANDLRIWMAQASSSVFQWSPALIGADGVVSYDYSDSQPNPYAARKFLRLVTIINKTRKSFTNQSELTQDEKAYYEALSQINELINPQLRYLQDKYFPGQLGVGFDNIQFDPDKHAHAPEVFLNEILEIVKDLEDKVLEGENKNSKTLGGILSSSLSSYLSDHSERAIDLENLSDEASTNEAWDDAGFDRIGILEPSDTTEYAKMKELVESINEDLKKGNITKENLYYVKEYTPALDPTSGVRKVDTLVVPSAPIFSMLLQAFPDLIIYTPNTYTTNKKHYTELNATLVRVGDSNTHVLAMNPHQPISLAKQRDIIATLMTTGLVSNSKTENSATPTAIKEIANQIRTRATDAFSLSGQRIDFMKNRALARLNSLGINPFISQALVDKYADGLSDEVRNVFADVIKTTRNHDASVMLAMRSLYRVNRKGEKIEKPQRRKRVTKRDVYADQRAGEYMQRILGADTKPKKGKQSFDVLDDLAVILDTLMNPSAYQLLSSLSLDKEGLIVDGLSEHDIAVIDSAINRLFSSETVAGGALDVELNKLRNSDSETELPAEDENEANEPTIAIEGKTFNPRKFKDLLLKIQAETLIGREIETGKEDTPEVAELRAIVNAIKDSNNNFASKVVVQNLIFLGGLKENGIDIDSALEIKEIAKSQQTPASVIIKYSVAKLMQAMEEDSTKIEFDYQMMPVFDPTTDPDNKNRPFLTSNNDYSPMTFAKGLNRSRKIHPFIGESGGKPDFRTGNLVDYRNNHSPLTDLQKAERTRTFLSQILSRTIIGRELIIEKGQNISNSEFSYSERVDILENPEIIRQMVDEISDFIGIDHYNKAVAEVKRINDARDANIAGINKILDGLYAERKALLNADIVERANIKKARGDKALATVEAVIKSIEKSIMERVVSNKQESNFDAAIIASKFNAKYSKAISELNDLGLALSQADMAAKRISKDDTKEIRDELNRKRNELNATLEKALEAFRIVRNKFITRELLSKFADSGNMEIPLVTDTGERALKPETAKMMSKWEAKTPQQMQDFEEAINTKINSINEVAYPYVLQKVDTNFGPEGINKNDVNTLINAVIGVTGFEDVNNQILGKEMANIPKGFKSYISKNSSGVVKFSPKQSKSIELMQKLLTSKIDPFIAEIVIESSKIAVGENWQDELSGLIKSKLSQNPLLLAELKSELAYDESETTGVEDGYDPDSGATAPLTSIVADEIALSLIENSAATEREIKKKHQLENYGSVTPGLVFVLEGEFEIEDLRRAAIRRKGGLPNNGRAVISLAIPSDSSTVLTQKEQQSLNDDILILQKAIREFIVEDGEKIYKSISDDEFVFSEDFDLGLQVEQVLDIVALRASLDLKAEDEFDMNWVKKNTLTGLSAADVRKEQLNMAYVPNTESSDPDLELYKIRHNIRQRQAKKDLMSASLFLDDPTGGELYVSQGRTIESTERTAEKGVVVYYNKNAKKLLDNLRRDTNASWSVDAKLNDIILYASRTYGKRTQNNLQTATAVKFIGQDPELPVSLKLLKALGVIPNDESITSIPSTTVIDDQYKLGNFTDEIARKLNSYIIEKQTNRKLSDLAKSLNVYSLLPKMDSLNDLEIDELFNGVYTHLASAEGAKDLKDLAISSMRALKDDYTAEEKRQIVNKVYKAIEQQNPLISSEHAASSVLKQITTMAADIATMLHSEDFANSKRNALIPNLFEPEENLAVKTLAAIYSADNSVNLAELVDTAKIAEAWTKLYSIIHGQKMLELITVGATTNNMDSKFDEMTMHEIALMRRHFGKDYASLQAAQNVVGFIDHGINSANGRNKAAEMDRQSKINLGLAAQGLNKNWVLASRSYVLASARGIKDASAKQGHTQAEFRQSMATWAYGIKKGMEERKAKIEGDELKISKMGLIKRYATKLAGYNPRYKEESKGFDFVMNLISSEITLMAQPVVNPTHSYELGMNNAYASLIDKLSTAGVTADETKAMNVYSAALMKEYGQAQDAIRIAQAFYPNDKSKVGINEEHEDTTGISKEYVNSKMITIVPLKYGMAYDPNDNRNKDSDHDTMDVENLLSPWSAAINFNPVNVKPNPANSERATKLRPLDINGFMSPDSMIEDALYRAYVSPTYRVLKGMFGDISYNSNGKAKANSGYVMKATALTGAKAPIAMSSVSSYLLHTIDKRLRNDVPVQLEESNLSQYLKFGNTLLVKKALSAVWQVVAQGVTPIVARTTNMFFLNSVGLLNKDLRIWAKALSSAIINCFNPDSKGAINLKNNSILLHKWVATGTDKRHSQVSNTELLGESKFTKYGRKGVYAFSKMTEFLLENTIGRTERVLIEAIYSHEMWEGLKQHAIANGGQAPASLDEMYKLRPHEIPAEIKLRAENYVSDYMGLGDRAKKSGLFNLGKRSMNAAVLMEGLTRFSSHNNTVYSNAAAYSGLLFRHAVSDMDFKMDGQMKADAYENLLGTLLQQTLYTAFKIKVLPTILLLAASTLVEAFDDDDAEDNEEIIKRASRWLRYLTMYDKTSTGIQHFFGTIIKDVVFPQNPALLDSRTTNYQKRFNLFAASVAANMMMESFGFIPGISNVYSNAVGSSIIRKSVSGALSGIAQSDMLEKQKLTKQAFSDASGSLYSPAEFYDSFSSGLMAPLSSANGVVSMFQNWLFPKRGKEGIGFEDVVYETLLASTFRDARTNIQKRHHKLGGHGQYAD